MYSLLKQGLVEAAGYAGSQQIWRATVAGRDAFRPETTP